MFTQFWTALKENKEGLIIGLVAGLLFASSFFSFVLNQMLDTKDEKISLHKEQLAVKLKEVEMLKLRVSELKSEQMRSIDLQLQQQKSVHQQYISFLKEQIDTLTVEKTSVSEKYTSLLKDHRELVNSFDSERLRADLIKKLTPEKEQLLFEIERIQNQISEKNIDIGETKISCDEYKKGNNWNFVSSDDCEIFEISQNELESLNTRLRFKQSELMKISEAILNLTKSN